MELVPAGGYEMGDHSGAGSIYERPVHTVYIGAFYMDTFEVTNEEYCLYLNSAIRKGLIRLSWGPSSLSVCKMGGSEPYCDISISAGSSSRITCNGNVFDVIAGKKDHPMTAVSWYGAVAYANWRSEQVGLMPCYDLDRWECTFGVHGYRLPTEAEWEKAARGGEYNPYYDYPWGDSLDGSMANFFPSEDPYERGYTPWTTPVGYYDGNQIPTGVDMANGYGLYDMAGNVYEWCNDKYGGNYYKYCVDHGIFYNPTGPSTGSEYVVRSGSWKLIGWHIRCANRNCLEPYRRICNFGFRLVLD
jgi:sulfatase modifying factor 1